MPVRVILDAGNGKRAKWNELAQLETASGGFDLGNFKSLNATGTAFNFYTPIPGHQFIITGLFAFATKDVSDASATNIVIYEGTTPTTITVSRIVRQFGMGKLTVASQVGLRLLVSEGVFLNAKTDDDTIDLNIDGHFIPTIIKTIQAEPGVA